MLILLIFAFISGLVTILAPCIWPLLPIVLASSTGGGHKKPFGITLGTIVSFAFFTLTISCLVKITKIDPNNLRLLAVIVIGFLGLSLVIPFISQKLETAVSKLSGSVANRFTTSQNSGFFGGFITGVALGIVWAPCAGPILATIATLAATQSVSSKLVLVTLVYVIGIGIPLFAFSYFGSQLYQKSKLINKYTGRIQQIFGLIMILTALAIYTNWDKVIEAKLLNLFPSYSNLLTNFESQKAVQTQLNILKGNSSSANSQPVSGQLSKLPKLGQAPNFVGITNWLNLPIGKQALNLTDLKGKVVLVDFWTYTCVNCIRTLPYTTSWYDKYHDQGFVLVGVHTPEFEFEKKTDNVAAAIKQYKINYPVAQDNDYKTWEAYNNNYWPAEYLIDAKGQIRETNFGEGNYDETEKNIQLLLKEAGENPDQSLVNQPDQTPHGSLTPETYLGKKRMTNFTSNETIRSGTQTLSPVNNLPINYFAFDGTWDIEDEYADTILNSNLTLHFYASKVFLVMTPTSSGTNTLKVFLDNNQIDNQSAGADVKDGIITIDRDRLYDIVNDRSGPKNHILRLEFQNPGTKVFAFTFG